MPTIGDRGELLREEELAGLETRLGATLPVDYRQFLLVYNGGRPSPDTIDVPGLPGSPTDIQVLFGIGDRFETSDLEPTYRFYCPRLGKHLLPIARDSGGNPFALQIFGRDVGVVIYADFGEGLFLYPVAPSFDQFLKQIRPFDE